MIENETDPGRGRRGRHHGGHRAETHPASRSGRIRQIVVHVEESEAGATRLAAAANLARALAAELVGIGCLRPEPVASSWPSSTVVAPMLPSDPLLAGLTPSRSVQAFAGGDASLSTSPDDMDATERWFRDRTAAGHAAGVKWRVIGHGDVDEMVALAKMSDVAVLGQHSASAVPSSPGFAPEDVALASGRPTLIVPPVTRQERIGETGAIIAWDGSREAVRAVHDGMPLLRDTVQIVILEIDRAPRDAAPGMPGAEALQNALRRHGFEASIDNRSSGSIGIAATLEEAVVQLGADLMIAGLHHHSHLREGLFGSVSHDLLRTMSVPVLVAH